MFILRLLSKSVRGVSPRPVGATSIPHRLVTESVFRPASTLKPYPVFRRRQLPYHLVQRCLHPSANRPGMRQSHWDCPSTLRPVDICAAFPSRSTLHQMDIHDGFFHVNLRDVPYRHPNHKSCSPVPQYPMTQGRRGHQRESSLKRGGYYPCSTPGQCFVGGGRSDTPMPVHLTDSCRWHLYDSLGAHSQLRINNTYRRYQTLMHQLSILRSYQSASLGASRSVTNTMLFGTLVLQLD